METFGIRIYKEYFNFAAAHFLIFEDGTREELHGHNYQVQMQIEGTLDDRHDVFIDFLHIKPLVKSVCDTIDHRTLLPQFSPSLVVRTDGNTVTARYQETDCWTFPARDVVILPIGNTSSERLAQYLCREILSKLVLIYPQARIRLVELTVEESRGQCALYRQSFDQLTPLQELVSGVSNEACRAIPGMVLC